MASERMTADHQPGVGYACIEWLEYIHAPSFLDLDSADLFTTTADTVVAALKFGEVPGSRADPEPVW
ncbi:hypothetical protein ABT187_50210 [Streptomyces sp. NPDC001817]|uniref:hypothetical protein n=1 Tax=Streptomyces sp. NPDC001817 TaxID=3154398 RepID=UPI00331A6B28